jgi:amino acid adenylation domain-containing protein
MTDKSPMPDTSETLPDLSKEDGAYVLPMSFGQEQLWLIDQMAPGNTAYNVLAPLRIRGPLDVSALERTLNEIVRRHEVLRTTFDLDDTGPVQVISETASIPFILVDLCGVPESSQEAELLKRLSEVGTLPFDLKWGPLCRAHLFKLGPEHHVLLWNMHHIVSDGWSYTILTREIGAILSAFLHGEPSHLPDLPIQYADFSHWQRDQFTPERIDAEAAWWKRQLDGAPPFLELPTDRPFGPTPSYEGRIRILHFKPGLIERLQSLAKTMDATLFTTTFAAFFVLMHRYTRQPDLVIGTPTVNRPRLELEPLIGYFVNTLPIRLQLDGAAAFHDVAATLSSVLYESYEHQELPFQRLVAKLLPDRTTNRNPIFQVTFQCHKAFIELPQVPGLEFSHIHIHRHGAPVDLGFAMIQRDGHWRVSAEYSTEVFDASTIDRMLGHYQTLLEGIAANPDQRLSDLSLLTQQERHQLLVEWNRTEVAYPKDRCLHELIEEQVERTPEAVAVVFEDTKLTYRQLNERASQLARQLQKLGVGPDTLVGICVERSLEMVVGLLGILKAGGAYVPLDPSYPKERLAFMLEDARPPVLVTQRELQEVLPVQQAKVVYLDASDETGTESEHRLGAELKSRSNCLVYVLYTSGSTGRPKGVAIEHRCAVAFATWARRVFTDEEFAGVLFSTSICFDLSVFELLVTLASGGKVIVAENALELPTLPAANEVKMINTVPSAMAELVRTNGIPRSAITINLAGEPLAQSLVDKLYEDSFVRRVYDLYGPTEATTYSTFTLRQRGGKATIGRPISNTHVFILDRHRQPVPIGVPGELYIGGAGLARGYLNRPELTMERFVPNPFMELPGTRLYKTGDLARYLPDGAIEYLRRLDHQVKIRGFRIELGEIESVLAGSPGVREALVMVREDVPGDKRLVAYLTAIEGEPPKVSELRGLLQAKLPEYMVPFAFVTLDRFPLLPNGKVDRKALPPPELGQAATERGFVAPRTSLEEALAGIWRDVLGLKQVGVLDNFFDLGGHSLLAIRVQARTESQLARKVPLTAFLQTPTIAEIAALLQDVPAIMEGRQGIASVSPGPRPQLLCFHFLNLTRRLDKHLAPRWPVRLIESPLTEELRAWKEHRQLTISLEALAARCRNVVQQVQPRGPYYLFGYCFAGVLAFEVASQLTRLGETVAFLGLLDAYYHPGAKPLARPWITRSTYHARRVSQDGVAYLGWKARYKLRVLKRDSLPDALVRMRAALGDAKSEAKLSYPIDLVAGILAGYQGTSYPGNAVLFRTDSPPFSATSEYSLTNGWEKVIQGGVRVEDVDCGHRDIVQEPYLGEVARRLEGYLSHPGNAPTIKGNAVPADRGPVFIPDANDQLACSVEEQTQAGTG